MLEVSPVVSLAAQLTRDDSPEKEVPGFRNDLSEFIYVRTYSRWREEEQRRETWSESVARYFDFIKAERPNIPASVLEECRQAVLAQGVMPSMRALWSAGEAARRDNTSLYNCFAGSERFQTPEGNRSFEEAVGANVTVRSADGAWRPATVQCFGKQMLFDVVLEHWTGGRFGNESQTIRVTQNHRWLLQDGSETTALKVGDKLASPNLALEDVDEDAVRHGFIFGDGTLNRNESGEYPQARLCGKKARLLDTLFHGFKHSTPPSFGGDPMVYCGKENAHWKQLPQAVNPKYIAGFLQGLFLADGCGVSTSGNLRYSSQSAELVAWVREHAPMAGLKFLADQVYDGSTNYGDRSEPLHMFLLGSGDSAIYRVKSMTPVGVEDVFCVVEPETRTFTLACGQVTGNCSFHPIDNLRSFSELLHVLMCGTGCGFSVEREFVANLPPVAVVQDQPPVVFVIEDSTEGWADALYFGILSWWKGQRVAFDYSLIRAKGSVLKIKGGRASGPDPLRKLMDFAEETILGAAGRNIKPIECHDICCQIAEIVMVGGFRRAALISISSPDDQEMRHAKDWSKGEFPAVRYMSNNSAYWLTKPAAETFWSEWGALVASKSGERGFLIDNWHTRADREPNTCRTNPCAEISLRFQRSTDPWTGEGGGGSFCVAGDTPLVTRQGLVNIKDVVGQPVDIWNGERWSEVRPFQTGIGQKLYRVHMSDGSYLDTTAYHRFSVSNKGVRSGNFKAMTVAEMLDNPSKAARRTEPFQIIQEDGEQVGSDWAYTMGAIVGDGTVRRKTRKSGHVWEGSYAESFGVKDCVMPIQGVAGTPRVANAGNLALQKVSYFCADHPPEMVTALKTDPEAINEIFQWCREDILSFLAGWLDADGTEINTGRVRLYLSGEERTRKVQLLLTRCGVRSSIGLLGKAGTETNLGTRKQDLWYVDITDCASIPCHRLDTSRGHKPQFKSKFQTIRSIEELPGLHHTFCFEESERHMGVFGNTLTYQCNLSASIMRAEDTYDTMAEKVRLATWLGVIQASFTHFPYLRKAWTDICRKDNLLGVDITGQCDNPGLSQDWLVMKALNQVALETAAEASATMNMPLPVAITCGKPSGNSSQLLDCASGFHPRYSKFYFRHVRVAHSDPLFSLIRDSGVPCFKENGQEHLADEDVTVWVARFPVASPEGALLRDHEKAIEQLERYLGIMRTWCSERGHNQSATIYVREHEWNLVGQWVYDHFDEITGLSFLPYDGGNYKLAPYEEITAEQFAVAKATMPVVDYNLLSKYEIEDRGEGHQELACSGGSCSIDYDVDAMADAIIQEAPPQ